MIIEKGKKMTANHQPIISQEDYVQRDIAHVIHPFTDLDLHGRVGPLVLQEGKGVYLYDVDGHKYLDAMAALWCTSLGYSESRLIEVAYAQMKKLPFYHIFNNKSHGPVVDLAEKLTQITPSSFKNGPMQKVFFANSGSEANDSAVKLVWYYNNAINRPKKKKIIARLKAYHGTTIAAGSLTGLPHVHAGFDLPIKNILHTDCPHYWRYGKDGESEEEFTHRLVKNLRNLIEKEGPDTIAAFIAEPVMGAGGVIVPPKNYFEEVQKVLRQYDILMIADEVITGFCRTGNLFGCETFNIQPDMITFAKGMSSAYQAISALLITGPMHEAIKEYSHQFHVFGHGFTNTAHPVSSAVALEAIKIYEERDLVGHVRNLGPYLQKRLREVSDHPIVGEVRGIGFLGGIELVANKKTKESFSPNNAVGPYLMQKAQDYGLMLRSLDDVIIFCPPLIFTEAHIDETMDKFKKALQATYEMVQAKGII